MLDLVKILKDYEFDSAIINSKEGRKFIIEIIDFLTDVCKVLFIHILNFAT